MRRGFSLILGLALLVALGAGGALAQGDGAEEYTIDWCDIVNGRRGAVIMAENFLNARYGELLRGLNDGSLEAQIGPGGVAAVRRLLGAADLDEDSTFTVTWPLELFPQPGDYLISGSEGGAMGLVARALGLGADERAVLHIVDYGVDCVTGDAPGVVRLWDDKMTMVIFRDASYDVTYYWPDGFFIHRTPYWRLIGPFEAGQLVDEYGEYERLWGATLRLYYLHDNVFQVNWYGPDGSLALEIPFTYPEPCPPVGVGESDDPGVPRVCDGWNPP